MIHIVHDRINRTLCGLTTDKAWPSWSLLTLRQFFRRRPIEAERMPVCGRCARAAKRHTAAIGLRR